MKARQSVKPARDFLWQELDGQNGQRGDRS
jgi:hypothetical protein